MNTLGLWYFSTLTIENRMHIFGGLDAGSPSLKTFYLEVGYDFKASLIFKYLIFSLYKNIENNQLFEFN
jgi:hypothetical protein